jgi:hypothetical protein
MEALFNEDSDDHLISESDSSKSSDRERPESPEIALISHFADEVTPETSPSYCPSVPPFTTGNEGLNSDIQSTEVESFVNLFITNIFLV